MVEKTAKKQSGPLRLLSVVGDFIFIPVIAVMLALCFFLAAARLNNGVPSVFNNMVVTVLSDSMNPQFKKGDVVLIKKISADELKKGDVIAFYRYVESEAPSQIWFHRIVDIDRAEDGYLVFQTKGDANALPDTNWTREDYVVGAYNKNAVFLHKILAFAVSRTGIIFLVIIPAGLIFMFEGVVLINLLDKKDVGDVKKRKKTSDDP